MQPKPETRRRFIYKLSASFGSMVFASHGLTTFASCNDNTSTQKQSAMKNKDGKLGIALVGLGSYSTGQLGPALLETSHCYLAGIVTGTPEKQKNGKENMISPIKIFTTTRISIQSKTTRTLISFMLYYRTLCMQNM